MEFIDVIDKIFFSQRNESAFCNNFVWLKFTRLTTDEYFIKIVFKLSWCWWNRLLSTSLIYNSCKCYWLQLYYLSNRCCWKFVIFNSFINVRLILFLTRLCWLNCFGFECFHERKWKDWNIYNWCKYYLHK
jgi:hypothetical protein